MISVTMSSSVASDHGRATGLYRAQLRVIKKLHIPTGQSRLLTIGAEANRAAIQLLDDGAVCDARLAASSDEPGGKPVRTTRAIDVTFSRVPADPPFAGANRLEGRRAA